jgi:hypothetical protein
MKKPTIKIIKIIKDYTRSGYASAAAVIKPWIAYVDRTSLEDRRPGRFSTAASAMAAARRTFA